MSTMRCCGTWKLPIGCSNWRRLQYSTVSANTFRIQPTASAQIAAAPSSRACSRDAHAGPARRAARDPAVAGR